MRELKFRQAIKATRELPFRWHYWGYLNDEFPRLFTCPLGRTDEDERPSYQYTGLKDKNGKEIYEGDILKDDENCLLEVRYGKLPLRKAGDCVCTYEAFYAKCYGKLGQAPYYDCEEIGDWMEVIGNIYENPELLEAPHAS